MQTQAQVLIVVHQDTSTPGLVGDKLVSQGYALDVRCAALGDPLPALVTDYAGVVVFGGPMSVNDSEPFLLEELRWIETVLSAQTPYLGICLGAQLLAKVLGARVGPHPDRVREIGYSPVQAVTGTGLFPPELHVYQWHQEGFDLPQEAQLLATGSVFPHQAFRYGDCAYGLQFHPEITTEMIEFWTLKAADQLELPGAQDRESHFKHHGQYGRAVETWLEQFLYRLLG
jgi:GMP synthase (glutamine-hydrolysing)